MAIILFDLGYAMAGTWTSLDAPFPDAYQTVIQGISGDNIIGYYSDSSGAQSFVYNNGNWAILPLASRCIDGDNVLGFNEWNDYQCYNLITKTMTAVNITGNVVDFSGHNYIGTSSWGQNQILRSFLYDGSDYIFLDCPYSSGMGETYVRGINGNNIVGGYKDNSGQYQGFIYDITTQIYTTLSCPYAAGETIANGINGNNIVGQYWDLAGMHGFFYDGSSWTSLSYPGAIDTFAYGISGNNIVGCYNNEGETRSGFIYTIPEPATLLLLGLGGLFFKRKK